MKASRRWLWTLGHRQMRLRKRCLMNRRFRRLNAQQPEVAEQLWRDAALDLQKRYDFLALLAGKAEKSGAD